MLREADKAKVLLYKGYVTRAKVVGKVALMAEKVSHGDHCISMYNLLLLRDCLLS